MLDALTTMLSEIFNNSRILLGIIPLDPWNISMRNVYYYHLISAIEKIIVDVDETR